jgi:hypothetical protein
MPEGGDVFEELGIDPLSFDPDFPLFDLPQSAEQAKSAAETRELIAQLLQSGAFRRI